MAQVDDDYEANKRVAESLREYMGRRLNVANAFETPILEGLMAAVKVEPLQRIGTVLDASARCYAFRVDNTYSACYKVLSAASGGERIAPFQNDDWPNDRDEVETVNSNDEGGDKSGTIASDEDGEGSGEGNKQDKNKLSKSLDSSRKAKLLTREAHQLAEGLWKRFASAQHFGDTEDDLHALFDQLSTDVTGTVLKRRLGAVHGSLDRKDNQFSIEDAIYRKISKDFEEGSARSFVSNQILMNDHGNFLILHTNWPGDEPSNPLPSLVNHLSAASAQCQTKALDQMTSAVKRAQSKRPSEFALLTQICADDGQNLPTIDFQEENSYEQRIDCGVDDFENDGVDEHASTLESGDGAPLHSCRMAVDETIANSPFADSAITPLTNGINVPHGNLEDGLIVETFGQNIDEGTDNESKATTDYLGRDGEAFGTEVAEREKQLAGGDEDIGDEQICRLIDENLLPLTQTDNENFVPLKNTLVEDDSHWMGDQNVDHGLAPTDEIRPKKGKTKRPIHEAGSAKAKRRLQKGNDFEEISGIADDMCWIPKRVVSSFVKRAIADIQRTSLAKRRLEMDADFSDDTPLPFLNKRLTRDRAKQLESMAYDSTNLLRARIFYKSHLGVWSFFPFDDSLKSVRLISRPHLLPPFSLPLPRDEQHNEFIKFYLELMDGQGTADTEAADVISLDNGEENWQMDDQNGTLGDEVPIDAEFVASPHMASDDGSPKRRRWGSDCTDEEDDDQLDTGFGFLNNITLSEIKQIYYQTNLNVAKVKKAMLRVISSHKKCAPPAVDFVMGLDDEADAEDHLSSCPSEDNASEQIESDAESLAAISDDGTPTAEGIQNTAAKARGINSRELFANVPRFLNGMTKRNLTVTNSFAVLLHLCNDKQFTLAQMEGENKLVEGHSMAEFFVKFPN
ncbi:hypothetical protein niasHT_015854 [Heterodera trifolii]|uniref:Condensin complex subunit 2 n=1 Tax=Heterodera trifolii TaxID=157864 RepID=A0ABD2LE58_9BILA